MFKMSLKQCQNDAKILLGLRRECSTMVKEFQGVSLEWALSLTNIFPEIVKNNIHCKVYIIFKRFGGNLFAEAWKIQKVFYDYLSKNTHLSQEKGTTLHHFLYLALLSKLQSTIDVTTQKFHKNYKNAEK